MKLFSGQRAFVAQRVSAIVLLAFVATGTLRLAFGEPPTFEGWQAWAARGPGAAMLLLLGVALVVHAWVGIRDVALDYIHPAGLRLPLLGVVAAGLGGLAAWIFLIVIGHAISHPALRP